MGNPRTEYEVFTIAKAEEELKSGMGYLNQILLPMSLHIKVKQFKPAIGKKALCPQCGLFRGKFIILLTCAFSLIGIHNNIIQLNFQQNICVFAPSLCNGSLTPQAALEVDG